MTAIHRENKALLHFSKSNRDRGKRPDDRGWPGTAAQRIERVAALENQQGEQDGAERSQESADLFQAASYHALE
jgi:hypothetical protein